LCAEKCRRSPFKAEGKVKDNVKADNDVKAEGKVEDDNDMDKVDVCKAVRVEEDVSVFRPPAARSPQS
jgi:hypothetical protein